MVEEEEEKEEEVEGEVVVGCGSGMLRWTVSMVPMRLGYVLSIVF